MNFNPNSPMIIVTILLFSIQIIIIRSQDDGNLNKLISRVIPDCVFGVHSVSYFLYTQDIPFGKEIFINDENIPLRENKSVNFLVHGFISEANHSEFFNLIKVWLANDDVNIISLDWSDAACYSKLSIFNLLDYRSAAENTVTVGYYLANATIKLAKYNVDATEITLIGHSFGAHIVGFAGKAIQEIEGKKYKQIIGLDPAGPGFKDKNCTERLCVGDAQFVQNFHTSVVLGIHRSIGNDDFYFNGGIIQPCCVLSTCDHSKSVTYLAMTLSQPTCFTGISWKLDSFIIPIRQQCNETICAHPGLNAPNEIARGTFFVPSYSCNKCNSL